MAEVPEQIKRLTEVVGSALSLKEGDVSSSADRELYGIFLRLNLVPALLVVTQQPRELTRAQLKELWAQLDRAGYSETMLRSAWRDATNEDIAASIVGYIRQAALGDALVPYGERVDRAMKKILASQPWTAPWRQWLERIGQQLKKETVVDKVALDQG